MADGSDCCNLIKFLDGNYKVFQKGIQNTAPHGNSFLNRNMEIPMNTQPQVSDPRIPLISDYGASAIMKFASKLSQKM